MRRSRDTLGALDEIVRAGKVREIGCSNFSVAQLREAEAAARDGVRFVSVQNEYSLLHREPEADVLPECRRLGMAFIPYYPLASGLLTGKYRQGQPIPKGTRLSDRRPTEDRLREIEALMDFAESRGHTLLELAFGWLTTNPQVRVGDCRRDIARAGAAQRAARMGAHARRARGSRPHPATAALTLRERI